MKVMYNKINYTSNYKKITEVVVNHGFFKDNKCISFLFKPSIETLSLFKNYFLGNEGKILILRKVRNHNVNEETEMIMIMYHLMINIISK